MGRLFYTESEQKVWGGAAGAEKGYSKINPGNKTGRSCCPSPQPETVPSSLQNQICARREKKPPQGNTILWLKNTKRRDTSNRGLSGCRGEGRAFAGHADDPGSRVHPSQRNTTRTRPPREHGGGAQSSTARRKQSRVYQGEAHSKKSQGYQESLPQVRWSGEATPGISLP